MLTDYELLLLTDSFVLIDWVVVFRPTRHKIYHFGDVPKGPKPISWLGMEKLNLTQLECGPMPNVIPSHCRTWVAPSVQRRKVRQTLTTWLPCSNAAKTRKPLKLAGVPQTNEMISAASRPKFTILWGHVEEILLLNKFFPIVDTCLSCEDIA